MRGGNADRQQDGQSATKVLVFDMDVLAPRSSMPTTIPSFPMKGVKSIKHEMEETGAGK